jgi:hypothetical protein
MFEMDFTSNPWSCPTIIINDRISGCIGPYKSPEIIRVFY